MEHRQSNVRRRSTFQGTSRLQRRCSSASSRIRGTATVRQRLMTMRTSSSSNSSNAAATTMMSTKNNPYVGWFRHAPPAASATSAFNICSEFRWDGKNLYTTKSLDSMTEKKSPYVGWFRHAPPSRLPNRATAAVMAVDFEKTLRKFIDSHPVLSSSRTGLWMIDGTLKGGAPTTSPRSNYDTSISQSLRQTLQESGEASPSATVQVLSRLATWILAPLAADAVAAVRPESLLKLPPPAQTDDEGEDYDEDDDDCSSEDSDSIATVGTLLALDNQDRHIVHSPPLHPTDATSLSLPPTMDVSISSLAEAYYAHQAASNNKDSASPSPSTSSTITTHADLEHTNNHNHRLDFVITQMDIARMARNASRHLDVESILSLPTIIYRCEPDSSDDDASDVDADQFEDVGEGSWMIVPPPPKKQEEKAVMTAMTKQEQEEKETCVICLEHFQEGDTLRVLPCDHRFHVQCVDKWLSGSHSFEECYTSGCPTCKKDPIVDATPSLDGSVPSWAFARLGQALATSSGAHH